MPHRAQMCLADILFAARALLEHGGAGGLTMRALARELHVTAPSLYFHVESRDDLLCQLIDLGLGEFAATMRSAASLQGSFRVRVGGLAEAYIGFAQANPQLFTLVFGPWDAEERYPHQAGDEAAAPVLELAAEMVGPERALFLSEALWSLVHGYTVLRLANQFRLNPEHEAGFEFALDTLLAGAMRNRESA
ncbi:MAG: TetR/AcrR family transcriptional regulator [Tepidiformaceae bacterium]